MRLDDSTISNIANEINDAIEKVTNVEGILGDTRQDLMRVQNLAQASKQAEEYANKELEKANKVTDDLGKALEAQNTADVSIQATQTKISSAREDLAQVMYSYFTIFKTRLREMHYFHCKIQTVAFKSYHSFRLSTIWIKQQEQQMHL